MLRWRCVARYKCVGSVENAPKAGPNVDVTPNRTTFVCPHVIRVQVGGIDNERSLDEAEQDETLGGCRRHWRDRSPMDGSPLPYNAKTRSGTSENARLKFPLSFSSPGRSTTPDNSPNYYLRLPEHGRKSESGSTSTRAERARLPCRNCVIESDKKHTGVRRYPELTDSMHDEHHAMPRTSRLDTREICTQYTASAEP